MLIQDALALEGNGGRFWGFQKWIGRLCWLVGLWAPRGGSSQEDEGMTLAGLELVSHLWN